MLLPWSPVQLQSRFFCAAFISFVALAGCSTNVSGVVSTEETGRLIDPPVPRRAPTADLAKACGGRGEPSTGDGARIARRPYVQKTTLSSTELTWTSSSDQPFEVVVTRPDGSPVVSLQSRVEATEWLSGESQHRVEVGGLRPGRMYCYALHRDGRPSTPPTGFRTAPPPDGEGRVSFVVFGDSGSGTPDQRAVLEQLRTVPFDLILHTGDVAYESGTLKQLEERYFDVYEPLIASLPAFPASGNHDYGTADAAPFREVFALPENGGPAGRERWYSFDWGPVHFVALDTERIGPEQTRWLEADLAANDRPWKVVYMHAPPFSSGSHGSHAKCRREFVPILERYGVQLVLSGHDHHYERTEPIEGVTYAVTGGGGRGVRAAGRSDFTAFSVPVLHFVHVTLEADEMRLHAIDASGQEFDSVRLAP